MRVILDMGSTNRTLTGIGWYAIHLAKHLPEVAHDLDLLTLRQGKVSPAGGWLQTRLKVADKSTPSRVPLRLDIPALKRVQQHWLRARQTRALQGYPDAVFHGTNFQIPRHVGPAVCTIHDMSIYRFPQHHPRQRVAAITAAIEDAARRADHLLTVSEFSKRELVDLLGVDESRVSVTHLAARAGFGPRSSGQTGSTLRRFGLTHGSYTLHVGTVEPRKNIDTLLDAYSGLDKSLRQRFPLVLAGNQGWLSNVLNDRITGLQSEGWLTYLGYVEEDSLADLYAGARAFVSSSIYEGFGLPVLEAMACGVAVIASRIKASVEVAGDAVRLFAPADPLDLQEGLEVVLTDEASRQRLALLGLQRARQFSWQRTAEQTLDVYRAVSS